MKVVNISLRILLGLLFVFASVSYFFDLVPQPELTGPLAVFMEGLMASRYMLPLVKAIELACGVALLSGRFVPLAILVLFPISINIFLIHVFVAPEGLPIAIFVLASTIYLAYVNRAHYRSLL